MTTVTDPRPTWAVVLEVVVGLTAQGRTPFRLSNIIDGVQRIDPERARTSIQPVVQGMTRNAGQGPQQPCGKVLLRTDHGWYQMLTPGELEEIGSPPQPRLAPAITPNPTGPLKEDEVKAAVSDYLTRHGYEVVVAWGHERGIDIEAWRAGERRILIEAKGEVKSQQQQTNYFLGALGELVQRLDDPDALYGLALPDNGVYRGLVNRLPLLARQHLNLIVFFVRRSDGLLVTPEPDIGEWFDLKSRLT